MEDLIMTPRMRAQINRKIDHKLDIEETILEVVQDCANIAYETCQDMEEAEHLAQTICELWGVK